MAAKEKRKLVLIGAGSASFCEALCGDLMIHPGRFAWELALCDIRQEALDAAMGLAKRMAALTGTDMVVTGSTDRRDLLPGADYVVTTIAVGGRRGWEQDVFIPRKYGINQPVGDTAMPGGVSRAMRMVPAMLDICRDVETYCPKAHFFNYSNPMAVICRALRRETGFPVIGLCHGVPGTEEALAEFLGVEVGRLHTRGQGLNHCTFLHDIRVDGQDVKPQILEKYDRMMADGSYEDIHSHVRDGRLCADLFRSLGAFIAPGDRHITEFFTELVPGGRYFGATLGKDIISFEDAITNGEKRYQRVMRRARGEEPLDAERLSGRDGETEKLVSMIHDLEDDKRTLYWANVPNQGAVAGLPDHYLLEMPCVATATGFTPIRQNDVPAHLLALTSRFHAWVDVTVDAAVRGSRDGMIEAVMMGGYMTNQDEAARMCDEMLAYHGIQAK
nr:hypothetical protein [bacterium]